VQKKPAPLAEPALSPGLRRYLYFTAMLNGAAILVVEILGAKMLSPYVGTSHFVWTAQIGVTLVSLAAGYWFGGWLVDRSSKLGRLYSCILLAAVYLSLTVVICEPVAFGGLKFSLATGALFASAVLFFVPLTLLATTGPFLVRVLTQSVDVVGGQVGRLSALSTLGSVAGTVLIGYVLIPFLPNAQTMFITAAVLLAVAGGWFFGWGRKSGNPAGAAAGIVFALLLGWAGVTQDARAEFSAGRQLYRANSNFGQLQVIERRSDGVRVYLNDYLTQNGYDPRTKQSVHLFTYMLHGLARAYTERSDDVLCIGLGVGIAPMQFAREGARVDAVEINPAVVVLAEKFFDLEPAKLNITIGDGRAFLNTATRTYDAVVLDAFLGDSTPAHLMSREAFEAMRRVLKPGGALVMNSFGDLTAGNDFMAASLHKTLKAVFKSVRIHADGWGNCFFVASDRPELAFQRQPEFELVHPALLARVRDTYLAIRETNPGRGIVLTDDFNPVEFHDAKGRERMRRSLASDMRRVKAERRTDDNKR
jgi:spermidine synthase